MSTSSQNSGCINRVTILLTVTPSALSGYTKLTDFTFTPIITGDMAQYFYTRLSQVKVVWDFGDGNTLSADTPLQPTHCYKHPGNYTVNLFLYDENGDAFLNSLTQTVSVTNYERTRLTLADNISAKAIKAGVLDQSNKITVNARVSWQDYNPSGNTIYFTASGSNSKPYDETYKYAFLLPFRSFYTRYNKFVRSNKITLNLDPVYCVLSGDNILCNDIKGNKHITPSTSGAELMYAKGETSVYYYDDLPSTCKVIAALDTSRHSLPDFFINDIDTNINLSEMNFMESNIATLNVTPLAQEASQIVFTSTGLQGMSMSKYKKQGDKFQVFASAADSDGNILKYFPQFYFNSTDYAAGSTYSFDASVATNSALDASSSTYLSSVSTDKYPYSSSLSSTYLSSFAYINYTPTNIGTNYLSVSGKFPTGTLTGLYTFFVSSSAENNDLYKVNENFDYAETLKSYRFQSFLNDYDELFDGVIGSIVGTLSSRPTTYGKTIFEKISNFVINNSDIDLCSMSNLNKFYSLINEEANFITTTAPPDLQRLFDLLSIRLKRFTGEDEKFDASFDSFFSSNSAYAVNVDLNNPIDSTTYTVTAGTNFVARQKFNDEYILIEPMNVPTTTIGSGTTSQYPLSSFNSSSNWGWPLDTSVTGTDLSIIYDFYPYISNYSNTRKNNVTDYDNTNSTLRTSVSTLSSWKNTYGIAYRNIDKQIREGLQL